ncbi:alpha-N-acetylglucosaminidase TIM-barrel domain-containing protein [Niabella hirudinis]|uniref:alpha-N-acetylglucosaminidase n=1 Tax=Niabella hirudinis TaxID=1285929 RepID=UPI003EB9FB94
MYHCVKWNIVGALLLLLMHPLAAQRSAGLAKKEKEAAAKMVLQRVLGERAGFIHLNLTASGTVNDHYRYKVQQDKLEVSGNSVIALTRGVYDYLKHTHQGMLGWEGPLFTISNPWPRVPEHSVTSPFRIRHAHNIVTSGYTTPYWTWERWERELDWQAMHGFNMLMAPVATEAIAARVWKKLGLKQAELDSFFTSPSLLPWNRMGNICNVGGGLPGEWEKDQVALQHKILRRMRELGIQPVVQSFAGFVPKALRRLFPGVQLHETLWNSGFAPSQRPVFLMPDDPLFARICKMYMLEWQKEFGTADYFLLDSFNEMQLPETRGSETAMLADYGLRSYEALKAGNKNAIWVIQGWMFSYQKDIWTPERVRALFSKIPDDKVLILDYANDYATVWNSLNAYDGKMWVYGFVPNMGGKTPYTGNMNLYATGPAKTLAAADKKNLAGFSISGEGLENNEVIYELLADAAWSRDSIDLRSWLKNYSLNRYGGYPEALKTSWELLQNSAYKSLVDHPQFNWQTGSFSRSRVNRDPDFFRSVSAFLSCSELLGKSAAYRADAIERVALALGIKAEECFIRAADGYKTRDTATGNSNGSRGLVILAAMDQLLESHPLLRLENWLQLAEQHSTDPQLKHFYRSDAKRIVTIWGPPVNDYSCRIWSGLIRDFYRERMRLLLEAKKTGTPFDKNQWEIGWVRNATLSKARPFADPLREAAALYNRYVANDVP